VASTLLLACTPEDKTAPISKKVKTEAGFVQGQHDPATGITAFKGIPFAAPPVGDLRWRAPQPAAAWEGVKECTRFAASAMQNTPRPFSMWTQEFIAPAEPLSEDCLYLNVWTGAASAAEKRPVIVYIYGGGFSSGSGAVPIYDGEELAKKGVVFLTVNYRVGVFGFLAHPELTAEAEHAASGNYGLLDQIAALEWVQRDIEAFGGDPDNVTIAGQSAGAFSVNFLVASPLTRGLIHRAIAESGGAVLPTSRFAEAVPLADAEAAGTAFAESLNASSLAELRKLPADTLLAANGPGRPIVDGYVIQEPVYDCLAAGRQNDVPLLLGWNEDEGFGPAVSTVAEFRAGVEEQFGAAADTLFALLPATTDTAARVAQARWSGLQIFGVQSYAWMTLQNRTGTADVYLYHFERDLPYAEGMQDYGAFHTGEVPYAYNNLKMSPRPWEAVDHALADQMSDYWVNFARTGDPNGADLPAWPACTSARPQAMIFDSEVRSQPLPDAELLAFLATFYTPKAH
jgi:para-nitrobenzyl esterase